MTIKIEQNGEVVLKIPQNLKENAVENFVSSKQDWIMKHKCKILARNRAYNDLITYKKISILGKVFDLKYNPQYKKPVLTDYELIVKDEKTLIKYLKTIAIDVLHKRIIELAKVVKSDNFEFKIDNSKVRWGSCSSMRVVKINFRVVMLECKLIDYVLIHELSHLKQMNHSPAFWSEVSKVLPNYKTLRNELFNYDFLLQMYRVK